MLGITLKFTADYMSKYFSSILNFLLSLLLLSSCSLWQSSESRAVGKNDAGKWEMAKLPEEKRREFDEYFFEALKQKSLENFDRAIEKFEKCLEISSEVAAVYYELGKLYKEKEDNEKALRNAEKAVELNPDKFWYLRQLASFYENLGRYKESGEVYEKVINKFPGKPEMYYRLANIYIFRENWDKALNIYNRFEKRFGLHPEVSLQKHRIYLQKDEVQKAVKEVDKLIGHYPGEIRYYNIKADIYLSNGMKDKALEVYEKMLELDPNNGNAQLALAEYYRKNGEREKAFFYLKKAFQNPDLEVDRKVKILVSTFLSPNGNGTLDKEALELGKILVRVHPENANVYAVYGDLLYRRERLKDAREQYLKSLEWNKNVFAVWQQLLFVESELQDYSAMEEESEEAMEYFPNQAILYYFNGVSNIQLDQYEDAVSALKTGLNYTINNPRLKSQFYTNLAEAYHQLKEYRNSDKNFEKALEIDPDDPLVLNNYSYYLSLRNERLDTAAKMSAKSLELEPGNPAYLDTYGWIQYKKKAYKDARKYIKKALDKRPKDPEILEHYGDILFKLDQVEKAVEIWKKARNYGGNPKILDKKIREKGLSDDE